MSLTYLLRLQLPTYLQPRDPLETRGSGSALPSDISYVMETTLSVINDIDLGIKEC